MIAQKCCRTSENKFICCCSNAFCCNTYLTKRVRLVVLLQRVSWHLSWRVKRHKNRFSRCHSIACYINNNNKNRLDYFNVVCMTHPLTKRVSLEYWLEGLRDIIVDKHHFLTWSSQRSTNHLTPYCLLNWHILCWLFLCLCHCYVLMVPGGDSWFFMSDWPSCMLCISTRKCLDKLIYM